MFELDGGTGCTLSCTRCIITGSALVGLRMSETIIIVSEAWHDLHLI